MGQLVTTVVGGVAGFLVGGPLGASIGMTLGGMVGQSLFGPTVKGPRLNDLKVSASTYGKTIPEVYGTVRIGGNMIWTSGINETSTTQRQGKGGGPKQTTYSYDASFAMGLCKGPIDDILRIWADGKLIYDTTNGATRTPGAVGTEGSRTAGEILEISTGKRKDDSYGLRIYRGDENQLPDSLIEADKGVGNVSAYRGLAYCVFENMQLENFGNRVPQLTFEVTRSPNQNFPFIEANDQEGDTPSDGSWFPDFELGIILQTTGERAQTFDLQGMNFLNSTTSLNFAGSDTRRRKYLTGTGQFLATDGLRNSAPIQQWNIFTMSKVATYGTTSNSLAGFVNYNTGGVIGFGDSNSYGIGNLGRIGFCRSGAGNVFLSVNWQRYVWILREGSEWPAAGGFRVDWVPSGFIEGRTGTGTNDIIGWRSSGGNLQIQEWSISGGINFEVVPTPSGPDWRSGTAYSVSYTNLNPFSVASDTSRGVTWNYAPRVCLYDPTDDCIFSIGTASSSLGSEVAAFKYQRTTGLYKFAKIYFEDENGTMRVPPDQMSYSRLAGGTFGWARERPTNRETPRIWEIDIQNGALLRNINYGGIFGGNQFVGLNAAGNDSQHWDDETSSLVTNSDGRYLRIIFRAGIAQLTIADVVADICSRTNVLEADDYDVSGLSNDVITGYLIDRETSARDVLRQLATGFLFDGYESDYILKFRSRGDTSQVTIPEEWIARDNDNLVVRETVTQELDLPMRVTVNYYDIARDHQQGSQTEKRRSGPLPSMLTRKEDIIDLPIVWTPDEAKQCADKLLKMHWANKTGFDFKLPWRYLKYDPTDVARIELDSGTVYQMRFTETLVGADFTIAAKASSERSTIYSSQAVGAVSTPPLDSVGITYPAIPLALNTPLLRDLDYDAAENAQVYLGASTNAINFTSALLFINDGFDFANLGPVNKKVVTGFCQDPLPPTTSWGSTDNKSELVVRILDQAVTLETITQEEMLNSNANAALVGDEIIQFREATQRDDGAWVLTGLLRARRGTNDAVNTHKQGDRFVLLDPEAFIIQERPPEAYNTTVELRAVPPGTKVDDSAVSSFDLVPRDLQPFTPEEVEVTDDDTTVTIRMERRSRIVFPLTDGTGEIHYRDGDKPSAKITYKVWAGLTLADVGTTTSATIEGEIALFDANSDALPAEFDFPLTALNGEATALVRLTEIGAVEGIPKWAAIERIGPDLWNIAEFY